MGMAHVFLCFKIKLRSFLKDISRKHKLDKVELEMDQRKMNVAKQCLEKVSNKDVSEDDLQQAEKKSGNLKDKIHHFKLLLPMFKDGVPGKHKISGTTLAYIGGAILYVVSPVDAIPDFLPIIGWTDDVAVVGFVVSRLSKEIAKYKEFKRR